MAIWPFAKKPRLEEPPPRPVSPAATRRTAQDPRRIGTPGARERRGKLTREPRPTRSTHEREIANSLARATEKGPIAAPDRTTEAVHPAFRAAPSGRIRDSVLDGLADSRREEPPHYLPESTVQTTISAEQRHSWQRVPTLRNKRSANEPALPRRKSSKKKKKNDHAREDEIRQLSASVPSMARVATHSGSGGGPLRRDSKKVHGGLNRSLQRPLSEISLPIPESMHSSMSSTSEQQGFRVKRFDVLSPRPTIRYSDSARHLGRSPSWDPSRASSRREKRPAIPEEVVDPRNRIEELADDLDASDLRTLMERDERRREKKRQSDQEKLQRKLQRRAEKQRADEARDAKTSADLANDRTRGNLERGARGREAMGVEQGEARLGVGERQLALSLEEREGMLITPSWLANPSTDRLPLTRDDDVAEEPHSSRGAGSPPDELEEPEVRTAKAVRLSQASMSPPSSPIPNLAAPIDVQPVPELPQRGAWASPEPSDVEQRASGSSGRQPGWTSLFRRSGGRAKAAQRGSRTIPSEFANTSRDSLPRQGPRLAGQVGFAKRAQPLKRTTSKFREDLPEMPISPPRSRVQSLEPVSPTDILQPMRSLDGASSPTDRPRFGAGSPTAFDPYDRTKAETATARHLSSEAPSIEGKASSTVVSQSMASIDSEGSWLSGKPAKRTSQGQAYPQRTSNSSLQKRFQDLSDSGEEVGVGDDEYLSRLTPAPPLDHLRTPDRPAGLKRQSSTAMASSPLDPADAFSDQDRLERHVLHDTVGRKPTVVHHVGHTKSREGLLNDSRLIEGSDGSQPAESPENDKRSFDYPGDEAGELHQGVAHIRRISAGSARLLNIASPKERGGDDRSVVSGAGSHT